MARRISLPAGPVRGRGQGSGVPSNGARDVRGTAPGARLSPTGSVVPVGSFTSGNVSSSYLGVTTYVAPVQGVRMARRAVAAVRIERERTNAYRSTLPTAAAGRTGQVCPACGLLRTVSNRCECNTPA